TSMHVIWQVKRSNGEYLGNVIPLKQLRSSANLIPWFCKVTNKCLSSTNSNVLSENFWLNKY
ncbi:hypothetical protein EV363DRAFT_1157572, partial [Boletus edulis]